MTISSLQARGPFREGYSLVLGSRLRLSSYISRTDRPRPQLPKVVCQQQVVLLRKFDENGMGLEIVKAPIPTPGSFQVTVRMLLRGVNPADAGLIAGRMGPRPLPMIPGAEGYGLVDCLGSGVTNINVGQRVVCIPSSEWDALDGDGTWQQYVNVPCGNLLAIPDSISDEAAAQFAVTTLTAYGLLNVAQVPPGGWLLQTAAGSMVGRQLQQLCTNRDISVINVVRRTEQVAELQAEGSDHVVCSGDSDAASQILEMTGGQYAYAALDPVGSTTTQLAASVTRPKGQILIYGALAGPTLTVNIFDILLKKQIVASLVRDWLGSLTPEGREVHLNAALDLLASGVVRIDAGPRFPLEEARQALQCSRQSGRKGRVYLQG